MAIQFSGFSTKAIHHGYDASEHQGALCPPMHLSSTFTFNTAQEGGEIFAGEREGHFYTRISNPTLDILEQRIAALEGAEAGLATASGMGAITATMWTLLAPHDEIIVHKTLYGCTFAFFNHGLAKFGIKVSALDLSEPEQFRRAISKNTKVVYFETPCNPDMTLIDIAAISEIAKTHGVTVVVDNTYATPYITRPLDLGADIVVHSATKYLGGHGDLIAGLVVGSAEQIQAIRLYGLKDMTGAAMSPFNAMLIMRGMKTLALRMQRHSQSAMQVAQYLAQHPMIATVSYPGLSDCSQHALAQKQMREFGGMISLYLRGGLSAGMYFMNHLNLIQRAVSLGDAETLIQHPASMTHSAYTAEERAQFGISDDLVRLSVGLEEPEDIIQDIAQALEKTAGVSAA